MQGSDTVKSEEALKNGERREFPREHCSRKGCAHLWDVDCHQKRLDTGNVALSVWPFLALCDRKLCPFDIGTWWKQTILQLDLFCYISGSAITMTVLMMLLMIEYGGGFTDEVDGGRGTRFVGLPFPQVEVRSTMYSPCSGCTHHCSNVDQAWI